MTWIEMPRSPGHVLYDRLKTLLGEDGFVAVVEESCSILCAANGCIVVAT
jgi:hypothetical protein